MISEDDVRQFKSAHWSLERKIKGIGQEHFPAIVRLSEHLQELIDGIESTSEREKTLTNPDIVTKIKLAKKGIRLSKRLEYFEAVVVKEFEAGNITQEQGKRFFSVTKHIKDGKMMLAKKEFGGFQDIIELNKQYEASREEMEKKERLLRKEQHRLNNLLDDIDSLERMQIDADKVRRYEELQRLLGELEALRHSYISGLSKKPVLRLLEVAKSMGGLLPHTPGAQELVEIGDFLTQYTALGQYRVDQLCECFDFSEKKLAHICPETTRFRKVIVARRRWFEALNSLERTRFLAVDEDDDSTLDLYAREVEGAGPIIGQIRQLRVDKQSCKDEYGRSVALQEKRKELSGYSRESLQKELDMVGSLLGLLHSGPERKKDDGGLLSRISSVLGFGR